MLKLLSLIIPLPSCARTWTIHWFLEDLRLQGLREKAIKSWCRTMGRSILWAGTLTAEQLRLRLVFISGVNPVQVTCAR